MTRASVWTRNYEREGRFGMVLQAKNPIILSCGLDGMRVDSRGQLDMLEFPSILSIIWIEHIVKIRATACVLDSKSRPSVLGLCSHYTHLREIELLKAFEIVYKGLLYSPGLCPGCPRFYARL